MSNQDVAMCHEASGASQLVQAGAFGLGKLAVSVLGGAQNLENSGTSTVPVWLCWLWAFPTLVGGWER